MSLNSESIQPEFNITPQALIYEDTINYSLLKNKMVKGM